MSKLLCESMTEWNVPGFRVRVWREESTAFDSEERLYSRGEVIEAIDRLVESTQYRTMFPDVVRKLIELDRVNAVEWTDIDGCGEVLYRDWP